MDHLLSRPGVVGATNKDSITVSRCSALWETMKFNSGSWMISLLLGGLAYVVVLEGLEWEYDALPATTDDWIQIALFSAPAAVLAVMGVIVPLILNPYILGWPFYRPNKKKPKKKQPKKVTMRKDAMGRDMVDIHTFIDKAQALDKEIERTQGKDDIELGSLATHELRSTASPKRDTKKRISPLYEDTEQRTGRSSTQYPDNMRSIPETQGSRSNRDQSINMPARYDSRSSSRQPASSRQERPVDYPSRSSKSRSNRDSRASFASEI